MKLFPKIILSSIVFSFFLSCNTYNKAWLSPSISEKENQTMPEDVVLHEIYLIGDAGVATPDDPIMLALKEDLSDGREDDVVIFLGDNIYPNGLEPVGHPRREQSQKYIDSQLAAIKDFKGRKYFIAGNHDWDKGSSNGKKQVIRQQNYIKSVIDEKDIFLPKNGCGEPEKERISDDVALIFIDSQWWLQDWDRIPNINSGCEVNDRIAFLDEFKDLLAKYNNEQVIVLMHHPLYTNGNHGGHYSLSQNIFPLRDKDKKLIIPLPGLGSIYPLYRKFTGDVQDTAHPRYNRLKKELLDAVKDYDNVIFAAGHEHNLQYFNEDNHHFIVSGAGSKKSFARKGMEAEFASATKGYSKLTIFENGSVWLTFFSFKDGEKSTVMNQEIIPEQEIASEEEMEEILDEVVQTLPDSITKKPSIRYDIKSGEAFLGEQYRDAWNTEVKIPVMDLSKEKGGLTVVKQGGGQSTISLRLEDENGLEYVLRTVDKNVQGALPEFVQNTWAIDLAQDQISAIHPFSAIAVAELAEAAGIYHTNPKIVWVPKQKALGPYSEKFGNRMFLFEERPDDDRSDVESFGRSKEIIGYNDLLQELEQNQDYFIDQEFTLRSRVFDHFIHDWDRHDDQWRWASFEKDDKTIFRPIPRDRDQAFYKFEGFIPWLASRGFAVPKFQTFDENIKNIKGWNFNARFFDRHFLNELSREDWIRITKEVQESISDEDIENAFKTWPPEMQAEENTAEIIRILKARRENLLDMTLGQYDYLSGKVNVVGTDKKDEFEIERSPDGEVTVRMYDNDKKDLRYERTFTPKETEEIRIFGREGKDDFKMLGDGNNKILVRIIGGPGEDEVQIDAKEAVSKSNTTIYDQPDQMEFEGNGTLKKRLKENYAVNEYDRYEFKPNSYLPLLSLGFNRDDGLFFGPGISYTTHGFRKLPYKSKYFALANVSPTTNAFNVNFNADWKDVFGSKGDIEFDAEIGNPFLHNFYGFGNTTVLNTTVPREFNWVRLDRRKVELFSKIASESGKQELGLGPVYHSYEIDPVPGRVAPPTSSLGQKQYMGVKTFLNLDATKGIPYPVEGAKINLMFQHLQSLDNSSENLRNAGGNVSLLFNLGANKKTILATRVGGDVVVGDYQFFQAPSLGNSNYLRGFRRDRFIGKQSFYQNVDLRQKLFYWKNNIMPGNLGILAGLDNGKVWAPNTPNGDWNTSYTGGLWYTPFNVSTISAGYSKPTDEPGQATVQLGFFF